jgi:hypothetical protein
MQIMSATAAAAQIGCSPRTIRRHATALGLGLDTGSAVLMLTKQDVAKLAKVIQDGPGRPKGGKS